MVSRLDDTIDGAQSAILEECILIVDDLEDAVFLVFFKDGEFSSMREILLQLVLEITLAEDEQ